MKHCISHPTSEPELKIRAWQIHATDKNYCAAALLGFFEYWHNNSVNEVSTSPTDNSYLQIHYEDYIYSYLSGLFTTDEIRLSLNTVSNLGFITLQTDAATRSYRVTFHPEKVQSYIDNDFLLKSQSHSQIEASGTPSTALVKYSAEDQSLLVDSIKSKYTFDKGNKHLRSFGSHKTQFYKTLFHRISKKHVTQDAVDGVFRVMSESRDFSIMQFFESLRNLKYTDDKILTDFIWVMLDGKIAAPSAETKGAKDLATWISEGKTTLLEIEDCFFWLDHSGRSYNRSLLSIRKALSEFDRVKVLQNNGRFVGNSLVNKTKEEKAVDVLRNRDYDSKTLMDKELAYKELRKSLTGK